MENEWAGLKFDLFSNLEVLKRQVNAFVRNVCVEKFYAIRADFLGPLIDFDHFRPSQCKNPEVRNACGDFINLTNQVCLLAQEIDAKPHVNRIISKRLIAYKAKVKVVQSYLDNGSDGLERTLDSFSP